jgi:hypothetical protein
VATTARGEDQVGIKGVRSPKLQPAARRSVTPGSKYYAGYHAGFVEDLISFLELPQNSCVLDPWNGAGTTTSVVESSGRTAIGFDINPVLVIVGKAKLKPTGVEESLDAMVDGIIERARANDVKATPAEPLQQWFKPGTAAYLRALEEGLHHGLVASQARLDLKTSEGLDGISPLAASFYVVLFETVRSFLQQYHTTNPTWIKTSTEDSERISLSKDTVDARFKACELRLHKHLQELKLEAADQATVARTRIHLASSTNLPLEASVANACISSPPYCTRIDYPVLTRPELAVLGIGNDSLMRTLRESSIGTTTIAKTTPVADQRWGRTAYDFVTAVGDHQSKASKSYYQRYFLQYFDMMYGSMKELRRTLKADAPCALVVQDSYYKDVRIDLAQALIDMGAGLGWSNAERIDFDVPHTMAGMHPGSQQWRTSSKATESLLVLR